MENAVLVDGTGEYHRGAEHLKSIEEVCLRVTSGGTPSRRNPSYYKGGCLPWLKTQELQDGWLDGSEEHITDHAVASSSAQILPANTVLMAMYGATVGQLGILRRPMTCNQACCAMIVDPGAGGLPLLVLSVAACSAADKELSTGAAQQKLSGRLIKSLKFSFPSLSEQRAIAHILGTLDDKIELNRRMNETLEAMARALFKSWFVDFDPVRAKMTGRDTGFPQDIADLFPDRLVDSEMGEIPKGWEVKALGDVVITIKGRSYRSKELTDSDTALVTLKSFARGGGYRSDGLKSFVGPCKSEQIVRPGEVVIACTDVTQAAEVIGRPAIVRAASSFRTLVASLDTMIVRPMNDIPGRAFIYCLACTDDFVAHTYAHTTGTTVLHLAKDAVPSFQFACPPRLLGERFDQFAGPLLERIQSSELAEDPLAALRDILLPKLISGEIRVGDAERALESVT